MFECNGFIASLLFIFLLGVIIVFSPSVSSGNNKVCFNRVQIRKLTRLKARAKQYKKQRNLYKKALTTQRRKQRELLSQLALLRAKEKADLTKALAPISCPKCSCSLPWVVSGVGGAIAVFCLAGLVVKK